MGGMEGLMGLLPGVQKVKKQIAEANISDKSLDRQAAIISSMTKAERRKPDILQASRKRRIAAGAGVLADVPAGEIWSGYPAKPLRQSLREAVWLAKQAGGKTRGKDRDDG